MERLVSLLTVADTEYGKEVKSIRTSGTNQFQIKFLIPVVSTSDSCFLQIKKEKHTILNKKKYIQIMGN